MSKRKSSEINDKLETIDDALVDAKKKKVSVILQTIKIVKRISVGSNASKNSIASTKVLIDRVCGMDFNS